MKTSSKVLITISIVLNVLFIGFYLGRFTKDCNRKMHKMHHKNFDPEIMEKLKTIREASQEYISDMEATRKEIFEVLTAPEFDPVVFETVSAKLHQCRGEMMCSMTDKIKEMALSMNQEERTELAKILRRHFQKKRGHWQKHKKCHHKSSLKA